MDQVKNSNLGVNVYPELPQVLESFAQELKLILKDNILGMYLIGSLATGDFDLDSDIDFLIVTKENITDNEVEKLNIMHKKLNRLGYYPAEHLEGSYISRQSIADYSFVDEPVWYLENGDVTLQESNHDNKWHVRWILREKPVILFGACPEEYLSPIPKEEILKETRETIFMLRDGFKKEMHSHLAFYNTRFGQSYTVLSICRFLQTISTGKIESKLEGIKWALRNLNKKMAFSH